MNKAFKFLRGLIRKYRHAWILIYVPVYLAVFVFLEETTVPSAMHLIEFDADRAIPFCEYFIIPYFFWFLFIFGTGFYFFLTNRRDYYRYCLFLFTGMTVSLVVYRIWPNGIDLRPDPDQLGRNNVFIEMVRYLYSIDTPTNVCPSIHVINSVGATIAICKSESLSKLRFLRPLTIVICIAICASTVFLKQHSLFDGMCSLVLCQGLYILAYRPKFVNVEADVKNEEILLHA